LILNEIAMSTSPTVPPFRADHVGSLLRPRALTQGFRQLAAGEITPADYGALQDAAICEVVALQRAVGLRVATDGEFRRGSYWGHFVDAVDGLSTKEALFDFHDESGNVQPFIAPHVSGKLRRARPISTGEFGFLKEATAGTGLTPKVTLPSPPTMHFWRGQTGLDPSAYRDPAPFFADLARIYRDEIRDLAALGCTYVQIDEVPLAMLCDPAVRETVRRRGEDPAALVGLYIDAINDAVAERSAGMRAGLHMCRGNFKGKWLAEGGYDEVAERVFAEVAVDFFLLEYDTPRAGDFSPLRFLAKGKGAVLGLVCSKTPVLEDIDALHRRVDDAAHYVPLERLAVGPQCGFASAVSGNPLTIEDEKRKLDLVVRLARRVWG
jgi:5-methyltetrahydropteroyltriglutamate--homocysteine methyltransferase